jgi:alkanesulfonate monooxygenase SsuD/methylene tetrahydromethanopterin reductase-like flavin-dependent oxidoreductase (luciferase family)
MRFTISIPHDDSTTRARERSTAALDEQYGYFGIKGLGPVAVAGPPDACVQGLREVFDAGAEMILLNPLFDDLQQMERLASEVMPRLRGAH